MKRLPKLSGPMRVAIAVLLLTIAISLMAESPVRSLVPFGLAAALVAWHHGIGVGFLFAGLATLAALACGAFPTHPAWVGEELGEGLFTYLKLSAIVVGVALGKRIGKSA